MIRKSKPYIYNPLVEPDSKQWLAMSENKRIALVEAYHIKEKIKLNSVKAHSALHVMVENQVALKEAMPVRAAIKRLMVQGADRHEAIHAVASVLSKYFWEVFNTDIHKDKESINSDYEEEVRNLMLEKWREEYGE